MRAYLDITTKQFHSRQISESFVIGFVNILVRNISSALPIYAVGADGVEWGCNTSYRYMMVASPAGSAYVPSNVYTTSVLYNKWATGNSADKMGVVLGTGSTPVLPGDYALEARIPHGVSFGELLSHGTLVSGFSVDDSSGKASFKIQAIFENRSGSSIVVNEVGIYAHQHQRYNDWNIQNGDESGICVLRDVITPVAFANDTHLRVEYTVEMYV